jgi:hypothetical protein
MRKMETSRRFSQRLGEGMHLHDRDPLGEGGFVSVTYRRQPITALMRKSERPVCSSASKTE